MKHTPRLILLALLVALPTAAHAQQRCRSFAETGQQVCGRLLAFWEQNGGLAVFGLPLAPQEGLPVEGRRVEAQVFERNRLELHPENPAPYDVLLGRLGADALARAGRDWNSFPKADPRAPHYFDQTSQAVAPVFWSYWSTHGLEFDGRPGTSFEESLALFGMPLSGAAFETNPTDGKSYLTQHFERARFEHHPENAPPYDILLGLLSAELRGTPPPTPPAQGAPAQAAAVIALVNQERAAAGCPALTPNDTLMQVAQAHSQDMADRDFFSHTGSDGRSPFQRMADAGYNYRTAAENIVAGARSPEDAVRLWMNSPGHRANILNCDLRETGVGYVEDPGDALRYGSYWTQTFGTRP